MTSTKTTIDWLRMRSQADPRQCLEALRPMYGELGHALKFEHQDRGKDGFRQGALVVIGDMPLGRMDWGGDAMRGWLRLNMPGKGCQWVRDWAAVAELEQLPQAELKRTDIALTTWHGEVSHDRFVAAHAAGRFNGGGRPPAMQIISSTDPRAGRTCTVGKRDSDKCVRGYEKGFEVAAKLPPSLGDGLSHIDGCPVEDIYRVEVELKSESRPIPWEVIERRDQYFAGAYPFCADLLPDVEADILMRRPERQPQLDLIAQLENCRVQYGSTLYTALRAYHGDIGAVWERIVGDHHNHALLAAGVMLVEHDPEERLAMR